MHAHWLRLMGLGQAAACALPASFLAASVLIALLLSEKVSQRPESLQGVADVRWPQAVASTSLETRMAPPETQIASITV